MVVAVPATSRGPGLLGCTEHRAILQLRGGDTQLSEELKFSELEYGHVLDDMSTGRATIPVSECSSRLIDIFSERDPWELEVAIYGDGTFRWCGLPLDLDFDDATVTLGLRDLFQWFERRHLLYDRDLTADLTTIFVQYAEDALSSDTSPNISINQVNTGITGHRTIDASQHPRAADEMRELARDGVDFTMLGRTLHVGGEEIPQYHSVLHLIRDMVDLPKVTPRADETGTSIIVKGGGTASPVGVATELGHLGLIEQVAQEFSVLDQNSADQAALSRLAMVKRSPVYFEADLKPSIPVPFSDLRPGRRVRPMMTVGARRINEELRLKAVTVNVNASEAGQDEKVHVQCIPIGAEG